MWRGCEKEGHLWKEEKNISEGQTVPSEDKSRAAKPEQEKGSVLGNLVLSQFLGSPSAAQFLSLPQVSCPNQGG